MCSATNTCSATPQRKRGRTSLDADEAFRRRSAAVHRQETLGPTQGAYAPGSPERKNLALWKAAFYGVRRLIAAFRLSANRHGRSNVRRQAARRRSIALGQAHARQT